jgi:type IV pilus assembly protein PilA
VSARSQRTIADAAGWPDAYGIAGGVPVPDGYVSQFTHPFRRRGPALDSPPGAGMMRHRAGSESAGEGDVGNQKGFTLIELLIVVAIIAIIAAVAIPALLRARVSANESATIGDVRAVLSAQGAYHSVNGGFYDGNLSCLSFPQGCIPGYPSVAPIFLDVNMGMLNTKSGYDRQFAGGTPISAPNFSPSSVGAYKYDALPTVVGQTGIRAFAGDHSGRVCYTPNGTVVPAGVGGGMLRDCESIQQ